MRCLHGCMLSSVQFSLSVVSNSLQPHGLWARKAPLSMEFSRQEHWSGVPFPTPGDLPNPGIEPMSLHWQADSLPLSHPIKLGNHAAAKSLQSCPTLCDPMDCSLPGSSVHGIFQARVLEWGAIAFSEGNHI